MPGAQMHAPPSRNPALSADHRGALTLLAGSRDGCPEALMLAHGFTTKQIEELVGTGHAVVDARNMRAGGRMVAVRRLRITAAGRLALRGMTQPPARRADALTLKPPSPRTIAAHLTVSQRVLLFCVATDTDWTVAGVTQATVRNMRARKLVDRDPAGHLVLTERGRMVFDVLVRPQVNEQDGG
jgi:hypothetical protein